MGGREGRERERDLTLGHAHRFRSVCLRLVSWWTLTWLLGTLSTRRSEMHSWPSTTTFSVNLFLKPTYYYAIVSDHLSSKIVSYKDEITNKMVVLDITKMFL